MKFVKTDEGMSVSSSCSPVDLTRNSASMSTEQFQAKPAKDNLSFSVVPREAAAVTPSPREMCGPSCLATTPGRMPTIFCSVLVWFGLVFGGGGLQSIDGAPDNMIACAPFP